MIGFYLFTLLKTREVAAVQSEHCNSASGSDRKTF